MHYEIHGDGPNLLLLHGGGGPVSEKWVSFFSPHFRVNVFSRRSLPNRSRATISLHSAMLPSRRDQGHRLPVKRPVTPSLNESGAILAVRWWRSAADPPPPSSSRDPVTPRADAIEPGP
jgi:hypothetical protein